MGRTVHIQRGTFVLVIFKTLEARDPRDGYAVAGPIYGITGHLTAANRGNLYPELLRLEEQDAIASVWGAWEKQSSGAFLPAHPRRVKAAPHRNTRLRATTALVGRFFQIKASNFL
jgi:hypothetical protein